MTKERMFMAKGVVKELNLDSKTVIISHEAISNYMAAMTMPFKVKDAEELAGLHRGDEITFRLHVTDTESWVDHITRIGTVSLPPEENRTTPARGNAAGPRQGIRCWYYKFTNELGQAVSLSDFHGQALAITFFYTRCPLPDYCPRLSKNFQEASAKTRIQGRRPRPTGISFPFPSITEFDTPAMLKAYGDSYQYDPKHWSFLTGPPDKIAELARQSGVDVRIRPRHCSTTISARSSWTATAICRRFSRSAAIFQIQIVAEIIKAAAVTNQPVSRN